MPRLSCVSLVELAIRPPICLRPTYYFGRGGPTVDHFDRLDFLLLLLFRPCLGR
jgi:hypothetical protein